MSRRVSTSFEPSHKEALAQAKYQGYIKALEDVLSAAQDFDTASFLFNGFRLEDLIELIQNKLKEHRGKYQSRFHQPR